MSFLFKHTKYILFKRLPQNYNYSQSLSKMCILYRLITFEISVECGGDADFKMEGAFFLQDIKHKQINSNIFQ